MEREFLFEASAEFFFFSFFCFFFGMIFWWPIPLGPFSNSVLKGFGNVFLAFLAFLNHLQNLSVFFILMKIVQVFSGKTKQNLQGFWNPRTVFLCEDHLGVQNAAVFFKSLFWSFPLEVECSRGSVLYGPKPEVVDLKPSTDLCCTLKPLVPLV